MNTFLSCRLSSCTCSRHRRKRFWTRIYWFSLSILVRGLLLLQLSSAAAATAVVSSAAAATADVSSAAAATAAVSAAAATTVVYLPNHPDYSEH